MSKEDAIRAEKARVELLNSIKGLLPAYGIQLAEEEEITGFDASSLGINIQTVTEPIPYHLRYRYYKI